MSVVCAGHVNWDLTLRLDRLPGPDDEAAVEEERGAGGGSAANVAAALARLETGSALLGSVGDDERGERARGELVAAGVDCAHLVEAPGHTATKYLLVARDGQVALLGRDGENEAFTAADLPDRRLTGAEHLHLTGQRPETAAELARRARAADVPVSIDPGRRVTDRDYGAALRRSDVALLNEREANHVVREGGPLDRPDATVVVKRGPRGASVTARPDGPPVSHPGFAGHPDVEVVDTTGAGDAFAAGYVAAQLRGLDAEGRLAVGNACGALATTVVGARAQFDRETVGRLAGVAAF